MLAVPDSSSLRSSTVVAVGALITRVGRVDHPLNIIISERGNILRSVALSGFIRYQGRDP